MEKRAENQEVKKSQRNKNNSKKLIFFIILIVVLIVGVIWGGKWLYYRFTHAVTDDAFISSDIIDIAPLVSGHIERIFVNTAQHVKKGQILAVIDQKDYKAVVAIRKAGLEEAICKEQQAEVAVEKAKAALILTKHKVATTIKTAKANLSAAESRFSLARKNFYRLKALLRQHAVSQSKYDAQKTAYIQAKEALKAAKEALSRALSLKEEIVLAKKQVLFAKKALCVAKASVKVYTKKLKKAQLAYSHTIIKSPISGVIAKRFVDVGDFVAAGQPILAIYDPKDIYIMANLEETKLEGVHVGCPVDIWVDAYPGKKFKGKVVRITPAAAAKFALIPRDVTAGEFTKVVQRLPVKIEFTKDYNVTFAPGMSVEIGILKENNKK